MIKESIFSKIANHKIPANIIYQDNLITAFKDKNPQAPVHIIIIPNIFIPTLNDIKPKHNKILGHMIIIAVKIAKQENISVNGYRLIMNCNKHAGQVIFHIHMHLIGGHYLGPLLISKNIQF